MGGGDVRLTPQMGDVWLDKLLVQRVRSLRASPASRSIGFVVNGFGSFFHSEQDVAEIVRACYRITISAYGLDERIFEDERAKRLVRADDSGHQAHAGGGGR